MDDPPRVCVPETIVDFHGGRDTWEENRAQIVEKEIGIRQCRKAKTRENELGKEAESEMTSHIFDASVP